MIYALHILDFVNELTSLKDPFQMLKIKLKKNGLKDNILRLNEWYIRTHSFHTLNCIKLKNSKERFSKCFASYFELVLSLNEFLE